MGSRKKVHQKVVRLDTYERRQAYRRKRRAERKRKRPMTPEEVEKAEEMKVASRYQERTQRYIDQGLRTIGVRFAQDPGTEYTYLVSKDVQNLYYGMEVIVEDKYRRSRPCYITRIDEGVVLPAPEAYDDEFKHVRGKVVPL